MSDLARRFPQNPLLRPADLTPNQPGWRVECLLNPGVFQFDDQTWLLVRVAERPPEREGFVSFAVLDEHGQPCGREIPRDDPRLDLSDPRVLGWDGIHYLTTLSHLRLFASDDQVHFHEQRGYPALHGHGPWETFGIEDCRVARLNGRFFLSYTAVSPSGVAVGLRSTEDWHHFTRHGLIFPPHNKDCALFEETVGGRYLALHRPSSPEIGGHYLWLAESTDLRHWGNHVCLARTRPGEWDSARIGAGASPIKTDRGWLVIYHGANAQSRYCLGALLLDLSNPSRVLARSREPIMAPYADYETAGFFGQVVFTNGHIVRGDEITLYYGAADSVVCGATLSVREILASLSLN